MTGGPAYMLSPSLHLGAISGLWGNQLLQIMSSYNIEQVDLLIIEFLDLPIQGGYSSLRVGLLKKVCEYVLGRWDSGHLDGKWGGDNRKRI